MSRSADPNPGPDRCETSGEAGAGDPRPEVDAGLPVDEPVDDMELADPESAAADQALMELALVEARAARDRDEVPIGAVLVRDAEVLARAHNLVRTQGDPTAHAEMLAIRDAARETGDMRLPGTVLYTTVEPCFMCAGAIVHARVERVVWAVRDPKFGGCRSLGEVLSHPRANHRVEITEGVGAEASRDLLRSFFQTKRNAAR